MPAATVVNDADLIMVVQGGVNKKATKAVLLNGVGGLWTKSTTNLSPTTSGDDILLSDSEHIIFGTASIYGSGGELKIYAESDLVFNLASGFAEVDADLWPVQDDQNTLGSPSKRWSTVTSGVYQIDGTDIKLTRDGSDNLTLTDANTGSKTLAELASGSVSKANSWTTCTYNATT
ncbi:unnamed protein product, partial [marine sediment metagenome]